MTEIQVTISDRGKIITQMTFHGDVLDESDRVTDVGRHILGFIHILPTNNNEEVLIKKGEF